MTLHRNRGTDINKLLINFANNSRGTVTNGDTSDTLPFDQAEDKFVRMFRDWTDEFCSN